MLIGHGSDYFMDEGEGRPGPAAQPQARGAAAAASGSAIWRGGRCTRRRCSSSDPALGGKVRFATNELLFRVNDRLAAPNSDATLAALRPELETLPRRCSPPPSSWRAWAARRSCSRCGSPVEPRPLATLLERAGGPPAADASLVA